MNTFTLTLKEERIMQIENFLLAITTFFSVAQLTCVISVPNYKKRLDGYFLTCYFITAVLMVFVTFWEATPEKGVPEASTNSLLMYLGFLFFVNMFNSSLADKIEPN